MAPNTKLLDAVQVAQAVLRLELALTDAATQCQRLRAFFDDLVIERMGGALAGEVGRQPAQVDVTDVTALVAAAYQVLETLPAAFAGEPRAEAAAQLRAALARLKPSVPGGAL